MKPGADNGQPPGTKSGFPPPNRPRPALRNPAAALDAVPPQPANIVPFPMRPRPAPSSPVRDQTPPQGSASTRLPQGASIEPHNFPRRASEAPKRDEQESQSTAPKARGNQGGNQGGRDSDQGIRIPGQGASRIRDRGGIRADTPPLTVTNIASQQPRHFERDQLSWSCAETGELRYIRERTKSGLKYFDPTQRPGFLFAKDEARHDFVRVKIRMEGTAHGEGALHHFLALLGDNTRDDSVLSLTNGLTAGKWKAKVTRDRWLFGGAGFLRISDDRTRLLLDLDLQLNPQRFLAHQPDPNPDVISRLHPMQALAWRADVAATLEARTLDQRDNVLIGADRLGGHEFHNREAWWRSVVAVYLRHIRDLLSSEMQACGAEHIQLTQEKVTRAEVVWELRHHDAISLTADLHRRARGVPRVVWREGKFTLESGHTANAGWFVVHRSDGVRIRVYAKCLDRLRVEVVFSDRIPQELRRCRHYISDVAVESTLAGLRTAAERRIHSLFGELMSTQKLAPPSKSTLSDFVTRLADVVSDSRQLAQIVATLATNGFICATPAGGFAPQNTCDALLCAKLVSAPSSGRGTSNRRYVLNPAYDEALITPGASHGAL